jgi:hypothetical protein
VVEPHCPWQNHTSSKAAAAGKEGCEANLKHARGGEGRSESSCTCTFSVLFIELMLVIIAFQMKVQVLTERMTSTNPGTNRFSPWNVIRSSAPSDSAQYWYCMNAHTNKTNCRSGDKCELFNDTDTNDTTICVLTDITLVMIQSCENLLKT